MIKVGLMLPMAVCTLVLNGCSYLPFVDGTSSSTGLSGATDNSFLGISANRSLVATDIVSALGQINGLQPATTKLTMAPTADSFGVSLATALTDAGYKLVQSEARPEAGQLDYEVKAINGGKGGSTVIVGVDKIKIKRDYKTTDGAVRPASSLFVLGADPENILLDNSIFSGSETITATPKTGVAATEALASMEIDTVASGIDLKRKLNINELGDSNFAEVLNQYEDVDTKVLVFGNDSMRLGSSNKWYMKVMSERFDASTDAFSVIGCSSGRTKIVNGNALLALGRAQRVKEELLLNGVPDANILDEGCWSSTRWNFDLPPRGVVVTLKRRSSAVW